MISSLRSFNEKLKQRAVELDATLGPRPHDPKNVNLFSQTYARIESTLAENKRLSAAELRQADRECFRLYNLRAINYHVLTSSVVGISLVVIVGMVLFLLPVLENTVMPALGGWVQALAKEPKNLLLVITYLGCCLAVAWFIYYDIFMTKADRTKPQGLRHVSFRGRFAARYSGFRSYRKWLLWSALLGTVLVCRLQLGSHPVLTLAGKGLLLFPAIVLGTYVLMFLIFAFLLLVLRERPVIPRDQLSGACIALELGFALGELKAPAEGLRLPAQKLVVAANHVGSAASFVGMMQGGLPASSPGVAAMQARLASSRNLLRALATQLRSPGPDTLERARTALHHLFVAFARNEYGGPMPAEFNDLVAPVETLPFRRVVFRRLVLATGIVGYALLPVGFGWVVSHYATIPDSIQPLLGSFYLFWLAVGVIAVIDHCDDQLRTQVRDFLARLFPGSS